MLDVGQQRRSDGVPSQRHPVLGAISLEYSSFSVDGRPDLAMLVYNPVDEADAVKIRNLLETQEA